MNCDNWVMSAIVLFYLEAHHWTDDDIILSAHFLLLARYVPNVAKEEYMRSV